MYKHYFYATGEASVLHSPSPRRSHICLVGRHETTMWIIDTEVQLQKEQWYHIEHFATTGTSLEYMLKLLKLDVHQPVTDGTWRTPRGLFYPFRGRCPAPPCSCPPLRF